MVTRLPAFLYIGSAKSSCAPAPWPVTPAGGGVGWECCSTAAATPPPCQDFTTSCAPLGAETSPLHYAVPLSGRAAQRTAAGAPAGA